MQRGQGGSIAAAFGFALNLLVQHAACEPCSVVYAGSTNGNMYAVNAADGRPLWSHFAGKGPADGFGFETVPAFAYINGTAAVVAGSDNGILYTLDAYNGTVRSQWKQPNFTTCCYMCPLKTCPDSITSPIVADGVVFVGTLGDHGFFYALDAASGNLKWKVDMQADVFGPPKVFGGSLIVSIPTLIRGFDRVTGAEVWRYETKGRGEMLSLELFNGNGTTAPTPPAAAASPGACYAALQALCGEDRGNPVNCGMCANAHSAKLLQAGCDIADIDAWCNGAPPPTPPPPTPPLLIGGGSGGLIALDARNGKLVWTAARPPPKDGQDGDGYVGEITVSNNTVYFGCWDGYVYAVDARNGKFRWRFKTDATPGCGNGVESAPAVGPDGAIFFGDESGTMYALESSGTQRWKNIHGGQSFDSSPVFLEVPKGRRRHKGLVIIGDDAGKIAAFDAKNGQKVWSLGVGGAVESDPIVIQLNNCGLFPPTPPPAPAPTQPPLVCNPALGKPACNSTDDGCCPIHGGPFYICKACCNSSVPDGAACQKCLETKC